MRVKVAVATIAMLAGAMPAAAQSTWFDVCGTAATNNAFKVCASAEVFLSAAGTDIHVRVWNRNTATPSATTTTADAYSSTWGGWHTITEIGIENISYVGSPPYSSTARHYHAAGASIDANGDRYDVLTKWGTDSDANSIQVYNTGVDTQGNKEGIVGCTNPTSSGGHVATCNTHPSTPYVEFVLSGFQSINLTGAVFTFHSQQIAYDTCNAAKFPNWANACTEDSAKGSGPGNPPPPEVVPEPITMMLLGTGLLGVGAVRRRRRHDELETSL